MVLDYPDGSLYETNEAEIVERLAGLIRDFNPAGVLTFGPDGITGHRDHIAIGKFATKAAARAGKDVYWIARLQSLQNLVESRGWKRTAQNYIEIPSVPYGDKELIRIDVSEVVEVKKKAIAAHASQGPERYLAPKAEGLLRFEYLYRVPKNVLRNYK